MSRKTPANKSVSGTKEWASHNVNCYNGCCHNCLYCYARWMALRFGRMTAEQWARPTNCGKGPHGSFLLIIRR